MFNLVDQFYDNPVKVGMVGFGCVCLEKVLEEDSDKVYIVAPHDFVSPLHKVDLIEVVPCYTQSVLLEFDEYLGQEVETIRSLVKVG